MTRKVEYWPKAPGYHGHPSGPWWCGNCGGLHGWDCPYENDKAAAEKDRAAGVGPFAYGPYPGGQRKTKGGSP